MFFWDIFIWNTTKKWVRVSVTVFSILFHFETVTTLIRVTTLLVPLYLQRNSSDVNVSQTNGSHVCSEHDAKSEIQSKLPSFDAAFDTSILIRSRMRPLLSSEDVFLS